MNKHPRSERGDQFFCKRSDVIVGPVIALLTHTSYLTGTKPYRCSDAKKGNICMSTEYEHVCVRKIEGASLIAKYIRSIYLGQKSVLTQSGSASP